MRTCKFLMVGLLAVVCAMAMFAQDAPRRIRIGGAVQQAQLLTQVAPVYPELAKQARIQGTVRLQAIIGKEGKVLELEVISGHPLMQQAALQAVSQWVYKPTLLNGEPVEVVTTVDVVFMLDGSAPSAAPPDPAVEIARLREEITAKPADASLQRRLATAYIRNREIDNAILAFREVVRLNPEETQPHVTLGQTLLTEKYDYQGAVAEFREALMRKADDLLACGFLARAHEFVYDYGQAALQYAECSRMHPEDMNSYQQLAALLYQKETLERATAEFRKYAAQNGNPATVYSSVAGFLQSRNVPAALMQAREASRANPDSKEAADFVAGMEKTLVDRQERAEALRQYIAKSPKDPLGYLALSFVLHSLADHAGALDALGQGIAVSQDTEMGQILQEVIDVKGFDGGLAELRKLARTYNQSASVQKALAELLLKKGLFVEAAQVLQDAVKLSPENREAHTQLAKALALTGNTDGARQEVQTAATLPMGSRPPAISPELASIMRGGSQPSAADSRITANETSAVGSLRVLNTVLVAYSAKYEKGYALTLANLGPGNPPSAQAAGLIDAVLAAGTRSGYVFEYTAGAAGPQGEIQGYAISARPLQPGQSGKRFFFTDQSGIIRYSNNGPATVSSPPIS